MTVNFPCDFCSSLGPSRVYSFYSSREQLLSFKFVGFLVGMRVRESHTVHSTSYVERSSIKDFRPSTAC